MMTPRQKAARKAARTRAVNRAEYKRFYGAVLCVVHPEKSVPTERIRAGLSRRELLYGNYEDKRFAWPFMDIRVLPKPIPLVGRQGIFDWPEGDAIYKELW